MTTFNLSRRIRRAHFLFPIAALLASFVTAEIASAQQGRGVCGTYFRRKFVQWGFTPDKVRFDGLTHIYYLGPELHFNSGEWATNTETADLVQLRHLCHQNNVKLIGSVGGRADSFTAMANYGVRQQIVKSVGKWYRESRLDGIDIDFEHPSNDTDRNNLGKLMQELRAEIGPRGQLSAAVAGLGGKSSIPAWVVTGYMDRLNIMSYDHGGEHATWNQSVNDLNVHTDAGIFAGKLTLGVPFYGVHTVNRDLKSYSTILGQYDNNPESWVDRLGGYYFNGKDLIRKKARYGSASYGGVFTWILDHDMTDDRSLKDAMVEGFNRGKAVVDGFDYPLFANPDSIYTLENMTMSPSHKRTSGDFGAFLQLSFSGEAWANVQMNSPELSAFSIVSGSSMEFDLFVPSGATFGVIYLTLTDGQGRTVRQYRGGHSSYAGWRKLRYLHSDNWEQPDGGFDWNDIRKYGIIIDGGNGGNTVPAWSTYVHIDSLVIGQPGGTRPQRLDLDADNDGVPDRIIASGSTVMLDRFNHGNRTSPDMVYTFEGENADWKFSDSTSGLDKQVLRGDLHFSGSQWGTSTVNSPLHAPVAFGPNTTLHLGLDVISAMPQGVLAIDLLDSEGRKARYWDYGLLQRSALTTLDLAFLNFTADTGFDASQVIGWKINFQGTHLSGGGAFEGAVEILDVAYGYLPDEHQLWSFDEDNDGDGLSRAAEDGNLNGITDNGETDPAKADSDGDGDTDGTEVTTGTDPLDASSQFIVEVTTVAAPDGMMQLSWPSRPGARYQIWYSSDLSSWNTHGGILNAAALGAVTKQLVAIQSEPWAKEFYRVELLGQ